MTSLDATGSCQARYAAVFGLWIVSVVVWRDLMLDFGLTPLSALAKQRPRQARPDLCVGDKHHATLAEAATACRAAPRRNP
jgi:hypothetical protein